MKLFSSCIRPALPVMLVALTACADPVGPGDVAVFASVAAGADLSCALTPGGTAYCWGGLPDTLELESRARPMLSQHRFVSIDANAGGLCGVQSDGTGICADLSDLSSAAVVPGDLSLRQIGIGIYGQICGLAQDGSAYCWYASKFAAASEPVAIVSPSPFQAIAVGGHFGWLPVYAGGKYGPAPARVACALGVDGQAFCWGNNSKGQFGNGTTNDYQNATPQPVFGALSFRRLAVAAPGGAHVCGATAEGQAYCWGDGSGGALGTGTEQGSLVPTAVSTDLRFSSLAAGAGFSCGLTDEGRAFCWGENDAGQLGDGTTVRRLLPTEVAGELDFAALDAGTSHVCGITVQGYLYCWGSNQFGQLGDGSRIDRPVPTAVRAHD